MRTNRTEIIFHLFLLHTFVAFWIWQETSHEQRNNNGKDKQKSRDGGEQRKSMVRSVNAIVWRESKGAGRHRWHTSGESRWQCSCARFSNAFLSFFFLPFRFPLPLRGDSQKDDITDVGQERESAGDEGESPAWHQAQGERWNSRREELNARRQKLYSQRKLREKLLFKYNSWVIARTIGLGICIVSWSHFSF